MIVLRSVSLPRTSINAFDHLYMTAARHQHEWLAGVVSLDHCLRRLNCCCSDEVMLFTLGLCIFMYKLELPDLCQLRYPFPS